MSGSSKQQQTGSQSSSTQPGFTPQVNSLNTLFPAADNAYKEASNAQAPDNFTAQFTPEQLSTFRSMLGFSNDSNTSAANSATGDALAGAGTDAVSGALSKLGAFNPIDPTKSNIENATAYANNPAIGGMVQAAMRDATQTAHDVTLPGITQDAAATGNINSSRVGKGGIAEGLVNRGLAQKSADISANLRGQAYDTGLQLSEDARQNNQGSLLTAIQSMLAGGTSAANAGVNARSGSVDDAGKLFDLANTGGAGLQASDQASLTNELQKYMSNVSSPFDALNQYYQLIGANNWGSNTTGSSSQTTTSTPSAWQVIGGLMGATGSLLGAGKK
jgi:hypothetical protein